MSREVMSYLRGNILPWILLIVLWVVPDTQAGGPKFGKITSEEWQIGAPEDYPEANSIIVFDKAEIEVKRDIIHIKYWTRIKILTEAGIDEAGEQSYRYHGKYHKLKEFKAHTISSDGKKHKVKKDAVFERSINEYKERVFSFPQLEAGCIIEFRCTVISKRFRYLQPWYFQNEIYTLESQFSICLSMGFNYHVSYQNVPRKDQQPAKEERLDVARASEMRGTFQKKPTLVTYSWRLQNLPPITDEPYMGSKDDYRSSMRFQLLSWENRYNFITYVDTWEEFGEERQERLDDYCNREKECKKLALNLVEGITDPARQSRVLFDHVSSRYKTSSNYRNWYFVKKKMSEFLEDKYGSAEAKNLLLVELHKSIGITAYPVLISTRDKSKFNPEFPDLRQFNHLIAYVEYGDEYYLIDASNKMTPYGILPPNCLVEGGFMVDGKNSSLVSFSAVPVNSYRLDRTRIYLNTDDGVAVCSSKCTFTGYYASRYGVRYDKTEPSDFIDDYFLDRVEGSVTRGNFDCSMDSTGIFTVEFDYYSDDIIEMFGENLIIKPVSYAFVSNPFKKEKRFFPVDFMYPFTYQNIVEIYFEDSAQSIMVPDELILEIPGARFVRKGVVDDSSTIISSKLTIENPVFRPIAYRRLRNFFEQIAQASHAEVIVVLQSPD